MKSFIFFLVAVAGILMTGCCSCRKNTGKVSQSLTGTPWTLIQQDGRLVKADGNFHITLNAEKNSFSGRGNCNSMSGKYTLPAEGRIAFSNIVATRAFCLDQQMEDRFFKALEEADRYEIDGKLLMLYTDDDLTVVLEAKI